MEKELDPEVIKATQIALGKYVKRPPLSEKLLRKPPFRFLHDIITTVLKTTGFFKNLFEEDELVSENVKDRDGKIAFLNKVIFVLSTTTGTSLGAKPSKIVAGQEPEKTNELLQCLAKALDNKLSSNEAVKKFKETSKSAQSSDVKTKEVSKTSKKVNNDSKKLVSRSSDKLNQTNDANRLVTKQDKEKANDVKSKRKENTTVKLVTQNSKKQPKTEIKKNIKEQKGQSTEEITNKNISPNATEKEKIDDIDASVESVDQLTDSELNVNKVASPRIDPNVDEKHNSSYTIAENNLDSSSSLVDINEAPNKELLYQSQENCLKELSGSENNTQEKSTNENDDVMLQNSELDVNKIIKSENTPEDNGNKIIRADKQDLKSEKLPINTTTESKISRPPSVRPSSSRPGAPRKREKLDNVVKDTDNLLLGKVNIIAENSQNEEDEDSSLLIIDRQLVVTPPLEHQEVQLPSSEHGHLVQQILESQKELSQISGKTEIEWQFGAQKAREAVNQEIEQLRFNIQALSRVANPLGKLLDHIQEDVEVMRQELSQWSKIYEDVTKEMLKQKTLNEDSLTPFRTKLNQLEQDIGEKHEKINDLKILVHKNAFRIDKLLASGNVQ